MNIRPFALERYFDEQEELSAQYLLSASDPETLRMDALLALADEESFRLWRNLSLGYTESQGHLLLRKEVSNLYNDAITPEKVLVCTPEEGIFIAMHALLNPGDDMIVASPCYQSLYEIARYMGCTIGWWVPNPVTWRFNPGELPLLKQGTLKLLVFNFPHNPTGALPSRREFDEIIMFARKNDAYIFSDEMYRFLEYDPSKRLPSVSEVYEKGISLCGMSKIFGFPGLRIGWLTAQDKVVFQRLVRFKDYTTICSSAPSEILALMGLRKRDLIVRHNLEIIEKNLNRWHEFCRIRPGLFSEENPAAGTVIFPRLNSDISIDELCADLHRTKNALLVPASKFHWGGNRFRIGLGRINFPEALAVFEEFLRERQMI
ncbi:MAG: aminotransferase class I/II-fold pyridoxal phosphate-dependent enzyme [Candidatus Sungbacteria bacterium]|nr:aminotransferase class I/II-fold pyridoxal phosphate-dependent enzyme [Candidatus Sungbacteria bacterium]